LLTILFSQIVLSILIHQIFMLQSCLSHEILVTIFIAQIIEIKYIWIHWKLDLITLGFQNIALPIIYFIFNIIPIHVLLKYPKQLLKVTIDIFIMRVYMCNLKLCPSFRQYLFPNRPSHIHILYHFHWFRHLLKYKSCPSCSTIPLYLHNSLLFVPHPPSHQKPSHYFLQLSCYFLAYKIQPSLSNLLYLFLILLPASHSSISFLNMNCSITIPSFLDFQPNRLKNIPTSDPCYPYIF